MQAYPVILLYLPHEWAYYISIKDINSLTCHLHLCNRLILGMEVFGQVLSKGPLTSMNASLTWSSTTQPSYVTLQYALSHFQST